MRKFTLLLLSAVLLIGLVLPASAANTPDRNREGSLTLLMEWDGRPLDSGYLTLYRVGDIAGGDGKYFFAPIPPLEDTGVSLKDLRDTNLPKTLADLALQRELPPVREPIRNGEAVFDPLLPGLYVVTQPAADACEGFAAIAPFLISLPQQEGADYVYDRIARPKVGMEQTPTEPQETTPEEPPEDKLPQTGQWNWPVPVMAVSGVALILIGWMLCFGRKAGNEE